MPSHAKITGKTRRNDPDIYSLKKLGEYKHTKHIHIYENIIAWKVIPSELFYHIFCQLIEHKRDAILRFARNVYKMTHAKSKYIPLYNTISL